MNVNISEDVQAVIYSGLCEAQERDHEYFTVEHILYAALDFDKSKAILEHCGIDTKAISGELELYFKNHIPVYKGQPV